MDRADATDRCLALFDSIHHVMAAERQFKAGGLWVDLGPVPQRLRADCGMALEFRAEDWAAALDLLTALRHPCASIHRLRGSGYERIWPE
jgi:hypothetical protein